MKLENVSAGGVVIGEEKIAIVHQTATDTYSFPKGRIIIKEKPLDAARREILEETGLNELQLIRKIGEYVRGHKGDSNSKKKIVMFLFKTSQSKLNPKAQWVAPDDVAKFLSYDEDRKFFMSVKDSLQP